MPFGFMYHRCLEVRLYRSRKFFTHAWSLVGFKYGAFKQGRETTVKIGHDVHGTLDAVLTYSLWPSGPTRMVVLCGSQSLH